MVTSFEIMKDVICFVFLHQIQSFYFVIYLVHDEEFNSSDHFWYPIESIWKNQNKIVSWFKLKVEWSSVNSTSSSDQLEFEYQFEQKWKSVVDGHENIS